MNRILIIGATGKYKANASVSLEYPTFAFVRPSTAAPHSSKSQLLQQFRDDGIFILQKFLPSEFGNEVDRIKTLPPFQRQNDIKKTIRRKPPPEEVVIYGDGFTKAVMNFEDDIAALNIMVANDPSTPNRLAIYKPPMNVISQSEIVSLWEKKTGRTLKRVYLPEAEMVKLSELK
ncbi:hypothetical protein SUGI_0705620 [Cryptomeria japonica]|nr:hypothetical protein SUGI_0705620 [Cryptomeria japonica]